MKRNSFTVCVALFGLMSLPAYAQGMNGPLAKRPMQLSDQQMDNVTAGVAPPGVYRWDYPDLSKTPPNTPDQSSDAWKKATEKFRTADNPINPLFDKNWVPEGVPGPEPKEAASPPPSFVPPPPPAPPPPAPKPPTSPTPFMTRPTLTAGGTAPIVSDPPGIIIGIGPPARRS